MPLLHQGLACDELSYSEIEEIQSEVISGSARSARSAKSAKSEAEDKTPMNSFKFSFGESGQILLGGSDRIGLVSRDLAIMQRTN